jgi:predicted RNA-binding Zn ribbon-like protein
MSENTTNTPDLPEFLNAEPEDMGAGLINMDTGERISWGDLEQPDEILAALARKAEAEAEKGAAE